MVNAMPDLMGQSADVPLTDKGRKQALLLSKLWEKTGTIFDGIYYSPYLRALDTAKIATKNILEFRAKVDEPVEIIETDSLREYDAGDWLGVSRKKTLTEDVKYKMSVLNNVFLPPNGESQSMVERRASEWLEKTFIYNPFVYGWYERKNSPLQLALFSHGMTIKCLLHYILGFDQSLTWKIDISNTSVSKLSFDNEGWHVRSINDCTHLFLE